MERILSIFNILLGAGTFAYIINDIGSLVRRYNMLAAQYK